MGSVYEGSVKISIFGQSHGDSIGVVIDSLPAGFKPDMAALKAFMARRAPGGSEIASARRESDEFEVLSGLKDGYTCGLPFCAVIKNRDARARDYDGIRNLPRPGHADFTSRAKFGEFADISGGGHLSGRLTAPLCLAGGLLMQLLADKGIRIAAKIVRIGGVTGDGLDESMIKEIENAKRGGDSVGGEIECVITGVPPGLGEPLFDGVENAIARCVFAIPGVKGIEFGAGFKLASGRGSEANDEFTVINGGVATLTNNCGGILGGIANGMPVVFRAAIKPTPTIAKTQRTVDIGDMSPATVSPGGRHDPCIAPRTVPCVEAAAAIAIFDLYMKGSKSIWN